MKQNGLSALIGLRSAPKLLASLLLAAVADQAAAQTTDALVLTEDGKVGIGTDAPRASLDVAGSADRAATFRLSGDASERARVLVLAAPGPGAAFADLRAYDFATGEPVALVLQGQGGNVGIGTTAPAATLDVKGDGHVSGTLSVDGNSTLKRVGIGTDSPREALEVANPKGGRMVVSDGGGDGRKVILLQGPGTANGYARLQTYDYGNTQAAPNLILQQSGNGKVGINTTSPQATLDVRGTMTHGGLHQVDAAEPVYYEVSSRYHITSTRASRGNTIKVPQDVVDSYCGDVDGCQIRLSMTKWANAENLENASRSGLFFYSTENRHWRLSRGESDVSGIDNNGTTQHVMSPWSSCYFTDGAYQGNKEAGKDNEVGMHLLNWINSNYRFEDRTCELTIID